MQGVMLQNGGYCSKSEQLREQYNVSAKLLFYKSLEGIYVCNVLMF
jgi:hypothetical protein